ncbi:uncharacterized protein [Amphiura filiformis]|uniref:uncharacterized protein n=1 Tax=Amphiura filiformis TaxID=82378 RepID=UPI003B2212AD
MVIHSNIMFKVLLLVFLVAIATVYVDSHGRLWEPPGRGTEWKRGYDVPEEKKDYNDIELFCGGRGVHWELNDGKCGVCGDNWADPEPRNHDDYGLYDNGYIVQNYNEGQLVEIQVELTTNHLEWVEFRLCARDDKAKEPLTHACLDTHILLNHKGESRINIGSAKGFLKYQLQLPAGVTCKQCVLQWKYSTGNDWGMCPNGTGMVGCSDTPEQFWACADISIQ